MFNQLDRFDAWFTNPESVLNGDVYNPDGVTTAFCEGTKQLMYAFELPGVRKEDISVQYNKSNHQLSVRGIVSNPHYNSKESTKPKEYYYTVKINSNYVADKPSLNSLDNGILYLGFSQKEIKDNTIKIEVK
jgi:HSP20 family molecular chaperone IbpA